MRRHRPNAGAAATTDTTGAEAPEGQALGGAVGGGSRSTGRDGTADSIAGQEARTLGMLSKATETISSCGALTRAGVWQFPRQSQVPACWCPSAGATGVAGAASGIPWPWCAIAGIPALGCVAATAATAATAAGQGCSNANACPPTPGESSNRRADSPRRGRRALITRGTLIPSPPVGDGGRLAG